MLTSSQKIILPLITMAVLLILQSALVTHRSQFPLFAHSRISVICHLRILTAHLIQLPQEV
jgi:hypothetical protein